MTPTELKQARLRLGLTQAQLAHALGFTLNAIQKMGAGDRPVTQATAMAIEHLFCDRKRVKSH